MKLAVISNSKLCVSGSVPAKLFQIELLNDNESVSLTTLEGVPYQVNIYTNMTFNELAASIYDLDEEHPLNIVFVKSNTVFDLTNYDDNVMNNIT